MEKALKFIIIDSGHIDEYDDKSTDIATEWN